MTPMWWRSYCALGVIFLVGCSGGGDKWTKNLPATVTAAGVVTLDGKPVEGASVTFAPVEETGYAAQALTDKNGHFELSAFPSKAGAVPGSYHVGVSKTVEVGGKPSAPVDLGEDAAHAQESDLGVGWENALPSNYANPILSGLKIEIPAEGTKDLKIELKSK